MRRLMAYLNPLNRLGVKRYSPIFPFLTTLLFGILSEIYTVVILKDPDSVGMYAIFLFLGIIVYFSFRNGILGGVAATTVTIGYYAYIIVSRNAPHQQKIVQWETTAVLATFYMLLAFVIGWLKQRIDLLIESEADERRRLQAIVEQLPVGVVITDNKGIVIQANRQLETIMGMKFPRGFIAGKNLPLHTAHKGKEITAAQAPLAAALSTGIAVVGKEFMLKRKDGREVYIRISASAIHNKEGKIIAAASIIHDITQQKENEKRKDDFVNMASHELKTPITSIRLYLDSLILKMKNASDKNAEKTLQSIRYQTERLQELVSDLLDVSRLQTGKLSFTKENFHINELVKETIEQLQATAKHHSLKLTAPPAIRVYADKFRIYQVVTNLITNAIKYSPGGTAITVRIRKQKNNAVISITDQGIGIAKDQHAKIFQRLYQVVGSKEKTFPGLGMGLYISKEILKRHGGRIWVESEIGKGSTFFFRLPLAKKKQEG